MKFEQYNKEIEGLYSKMSELDKEYIKTNAKYQVGDLLVLKHGTWDEELVMDDHMILHDGDIIYYAKKFRTDGVLMLLPFQLKKAQLENCKKVGTYDFKKEKKVYDK